jgi:CxxC motif-containing protein (DUF1111 family)
MHRTNVALAIGAALVSPCGDSRSPPVDAIRDLQFETRTAFGDPLPGLAADELALFKHGKTVFEQVEDVAEGLGPVFNEASCVACHAGPAVGGSTGRLETRFGRRNGDGSFDPLVSEGGSLLQDHAIGAVAGYAYLAETVPPDANVTAQRRTTPLFGLGLVDATPDAEFHAIAAVQSRLSPDVAGTVSIVPNVFTGKPGVGKFGWKGQNPTLLQFAGDAYLNEMGITSPKFPDESCPQGKCEQLAHNPRPDLNDPDGADVQAFTDFMSFLAPPPRAPRTLKSVIGGGVFNVLGCALCHVPTLVTGPNALRALDRVAYHPFSDFLLHDMGSLGDGIVQGATGARQMRTAPLWGMRVAPSLLHDGRAATATEAILAHDGQARRARDRFAALDARAKDALLAFLDTL